MERKCKYCGEKLRKCDHGKMCATCAGKSPIMKKFVQARDRLRELAGLEPMELTENTND